MAKRLGIVGLVFAMLLMLTPEATFAKKNTNPVVQAEGINYLALGDSVASGQTPYGIRVGNGYTDMLAAKVQEEGYLNTWSKMYAVSGANSAQVFQQAQAATNEIAKADLVTISAGANDLLPYLIQQLAIYQQTGIFKIDQTVVAAGIQQASINVGKTVGYIQTINPESRVVIVGYYNALPQLPANLQPVTTQGVMALNSALLQVATATGAVFVNPYESFAAAGVGYLPNALDIHPNEAGYAAIADLVWSEVEPALPAMKANHILNQAAAIPLTNPSNIDNALKLAKKSISYIAKVKDETDKDYLKKELYDLIKKIGIARKEIQVKQ